KGFTGWSESHPGNYKAEPGIGLNGRTGLVSVRDTPQIHPKLVRSFKGIPGKRYLAKLHVRVDNLYRHEIPKDKQKELRVHPFYFDHFDAANKYAGGSYSTVAIATGKKTGWYEVTKEFIYPAKADHSTLTIGGYLPNNNGNLTGVLYYSDMEITELGDTMSLLYPIKPSQLILDDQGTITMRIHDFINRPKSRLRVRAFLNGNEYLAPIINRDAVVSLGKLPVGHHDILFQLLDTASKTIIGSQNYVFTVPAPGEGDFPGSARIDEFGRLIVDGKPFAPRFSCVSPNTLDKKTIDGLIAGGFNSLLPYSAATMTLDAEGVTPRTIACLKRGLDYIHAHGLKVVFCLKEQIQNGITEFDGIKGRIEICEYIVRNFKRHPAILCWYVSDENPLHEIPRIIDLRNRLSVIDPFHPILTCTDVPANQFHFAQTGDIMNPDSYPIRTAESKSMAAIRQHLLADTGLPVWFAIQAFNWATFMNDGSYDYYRYPTEEEMRSMGLLALNCGVRGFSYYSYTSIHIRQEKKDPSSSKWFWPQVVSVVSLLRELEPFFNAVKPPVPLELKSESENFVEAKLHEFGSKQCVVITADGPGTAKATFRLPEGLNLKPRFGHTVQNADGSFTFTGEDICSDVLTE
ncbi:MAG: hypothetical protein J6X55_02070, partial [Victivallales bacterium]|nr:hypothetical protein [Victivallales bacterium]